MPWVASSSSPAARCSICANFGTRVGSTAARRSSKSKPVSPGPTSFEGYLALQRGPGPSFGIRQKQTGADRLTVGGAVSANIHGRGLNAQPFVADIEALEVVTPKGEVTALQP